MTTNRKNSPTSGRPEWPGSAHSPLVSPLQVSVAYTARDPDALDDLYEGRAEGYTYAREGHPNADVLAGLIDDLEGHPGGIITGSGMSAVSAALMATLKAGDHVIGGDQLYGRSLRLLTEDLPRMGIASSFADPTKIESIQSAIRPETRAILVETISNPTLRIPDIQAISELSKSHSIILILDNTFTTPLGFSGWQSGADIVLHSVTKLLAGHSDVTLGYVAAKNAELNEKIKVFTTTWGLTPSPFDCWLAERGMLTFRLRYEKATQNAVALANVLGETKGVAQVLYPGRADHPDFARSRQLLSPGNMVSFRIEGARDAAVAFTRAAAPLAFAPTLGDVSTTISHPASSSHRALGENDRLALGITEGFFRISVGVEDSDTIIGNILTGISASQINN